MSVTVRGDITGDITSGQLYRIDALRNLTTGEGGTISGDLRSTRANFAVVALVGEVSIRYVRAAWELAGDVVAQPDPGVTFSPTHDPSTWSSIDRVVVGPSTSAVGLTGSVIAEYGEVEDVLFTGKVGGSQAALSSIRAGVRVNRISARTENQTAILAAPVYANIDCSVRIIGSPNVVRRTRILRRSSRASPEGAAPHAATRTSTATATSAQTRTSKRSSG